MANHLWFVPSRIRHATACCILVFRHYTTCPRDRTYKFFPSDSIFYQPVLCGCNQSLTGHSYLLHTIHVFVGTRGLTFVQSVLLLSTHSSQWLSSSVCNLIRHRLIHLPRPGSGARRSPLIYLVNRIRSDGRP